MAKSYGDAVVLVRKSRDGSIERLNAIVLATSTHTPITLDRKPVKDADPGEHLDIAYAVQTPTGQPPKTRDMGEIFRPAYDVAPYVEDAWVGYEEAAKSEDLTLEQLAALAKPLWEAEQKARDVVEDEAEAQERAAADAKAKEEAEASALAAQAQAEADAKASADGKPSAEDLDAVAAEQALKGDAQI